MNPVPKTSIAHKPTHERCYCGHPSAVPAQGFGEDSLEEACEIVTMLEIRNVWYRYSETSQAWALKDISLTISQGTLTALAGPSACGKSTLLYLAAGLLSRRPELFRGVMKLENETRQESDLQETSVGLLLQDPSRQLHQLTVLDELRSGPLYRGDSWNVSEEKARAAATNLLSEDLLCASPSEISLGQQQRVALAALLAVEHEILLLDEPFSCLDGEGARNLLDVLLFLANAGKAVVVSTHDLSWLGVRPDSMLLMDEGTLVASGPPSEVLNSSLLENTVGTPLSVRVGRAAASVLGLSQNPFTWGDLAETAPTPQAPPEMRDTGSKRQSRETAKILDVSIHSAGWEPKKWILRDIAFSLKPGEILGVLGRNGSGKSTLARALLGTVPYVEGQVRIGSKSPDGRDRVQPGELCLLTQNPSDMLFETSCLREVRFGPDLLGRSGASSLAAAALAEVNMSSKLNHHPRSLSVGQQRLVTFASVTACEPSIAILDEPEYGLDLRSWRQLAQSLMLRAEKEGTSIILITHNLELAFSICSKLLLLEDGRAWSGASEQLLRHLGDSTRGALTPEPSGLEWMAWSCMSRLDLLQSSELESLLRRHLSETSF